MSKEVNMNDELGISWKTVDDNFSDVERVKLFTNFIDNCCYEIHEHVRELWDRYKTDNSDLWEEK